MIVQERIRKDSNALAARLNELGIGVNEVKLVDWNPMFVDILYEISDEKQEKIKAAEREQERLKKAVGAR